MSSDEIAEALGHWAQYVTARKNLLSTGVVRSLKASEADFAEWLVATLVGGTLPISQSHRAFDVVAGGQRIQVKSLCKALGNPNGYIVTPRDLANDSVTGATHYAFVFFNDLVPDAVFVLPEDVIRLWSRTQIKRQDLEGHIASVRLWPV